MANDAYYGESGSLHDELVARLPHSGPIYKCDNKSVYLKIEKATRGTSVESTVKAFSRPKDGRAAFEALLANHAGEVKYRAILKRRMNILRDVKWNGRTYPLESHVSNHRQAVDDIRECSTHITAPVPDQAQRVEDLIDSIQSQDSSLQATIGLIRANTNNMREDFEAAASALIEVDPFRRSQRDTTKNRDANVSGIDFSAGRGKTGVDLRWHPTSEFKKLNIDQQKELNAFLKTPEGKEKMKESRKAQQKANKRKNPGGDEGGNDPKVKAGAKQNWKKKMKKAIKTPNGLKAVYSIMAENEQNLAQQSNFAASIQAAAAAPAASFPVPPPPPPRPPLPSVPQVSFAPPVSAPAVTPPAHPQVGSMQSFFPATVTRLQGIMKNPRQP